MTMAQDDILQCQKGVLCDPDADTVQRIHDPRTEPGRNEPCRRR